MRLRLLLITVLGLLVAMTGVAGAQQPSTGTLEFSHDVSGADAVGAAVRLFGDSDDVESLGDEIAPGQSADVALPPGEHELILFTEGTEGLLGAATFTITAGETTLIRASSLLGSAPSTPSTGTGTLVFSHDVSGGDPVGAAVRLFGDDDDVESLGDEIRPGQRADITLPAGEHELILFTEGNPDLLGAATFSIEAGETTTLRASSVLDDEPRPAATPPVRTPNRVDTGAGGAAGNAPAGLAALLVALTALIAGMFLRRAA